MFSLSFKSSSFHHIYSHSCGYQAALALLKLYRNKSTQVFSGPKDWQGHLVMVQWMRLFLTRWQLNSVPLQREWWLKRSNEMLNCLTQVWTQTVWKFFIYFVQQMGLEIWKLHFLAENKRTVMWYCCRALRLIMLPSAVCSFIYGLSLLLPIDLCIYIFFVKINSLIGFVFLFLTMANSIPQN